MRLLVNEAVGPAVRGRTFSRNETVAAFRLPCWNKEAELVATRSLSPLAASDSRRYLIPTAWQGAPRSGRWRDETQSAPHKVDLGVLYRGPPFRRP
jgi:hypothetical protein